MAQQFLSDDPLKRVPEIESSQKAAVQDINDIYDFVYHSAKYKTPPPTPSLGVNTLGEVPDSSWYTNRPKLSLEELKTGARVHGEPQAPFTVVAAKTEGVTPGFRIKDARGLIYFIKVDPQSNPEMATAADVIGSLFLYAAGYNVPENYILIASRKDFRLSEKAMITALSGKRHPMNHDQLEKILDAVPTEPGGKIRLMASLSVEGRIVGPFRYESVRSDDPNDLIQHQQRRDLRGLEVLFAWINHTDAKGDNTLDSVVGKGPDARVVHHLLDFGDSFGSDSDIAKDPRHGQEDWLPTSGEQAKRALTFGLVPAKWETVRYPHHLPAAGNFTASGFDPLTWKPNYPNPAFLAMTPIDAYWGAKRVTSFKEDEIRAIVGEGQFSDPGVAEYITKVLIARRDIIGRAWFSRVAPLEDFTIAGGELHYTDLGATSDLLPASSYAISWFSFDNQNSRRTPVAGSSSQVPSDLASAQEGAFIGCTLTEAKEARKGVTVIFRRSTEGWQAVGIDRTSL
ncbi:hypothetical protein FTW19_13405 [Terriglobus albidus]|uniref:Uncharacterized protein n=1 Tax=Terriglobus albidus TaxID=1592106 RepID=A0A5B9ECN6_9BACT|nr:hypothetical protein [Terriglobus albidus]QEE28905.1 hypothetical protein FTW19_13405 [Terriglobus albidus]